MKLDSFFSTIREKPYETQVILLIAGLAFIRVIIALYVDFSRPEIYFLEILTDSGLLIIFGGLFLSVTTKANFQSVHWAFGIIMIVLLALNFLQFKGVAGSSRFNFYCGFFVSILLYQKRTLVWVLIFQSAVLVTLVIMSHQQLAWINNLVISTEPDPTDFFFALLALGILNTYLKNITINEILQFGVLNQSLRDAVAKAKQVNGLLIKSADELSWAQLQLSREVKRRTNRLSETGGAIETYIKINSTDLQEPILKLNEVIKNLPHDEGLTTMLRVSGQELHEVMQSIQSALQTGQDIDRNKIRQK